MAWYWRWWWGEEACNIEDVWELDSFEMMYYLEGGVVVVAEGEYSRDRNEGREAENGKRNKLEE